MDFGFFLGVAVLYLELVFGQYDTRNEDVIEFKLCALMNAIAIAKYWCEHIIAWFSMQRLNIAVENNAS